MTSNNNNNDRKRKAVHYSATQNHCAGCNLYGRSTKMKHSCPIPEPCYIPLPYRSGSNFRICKACYQLHYTLGKKRNNQVFTSCNDTINNPTDPNIYKLAHSVLSASPATTSKKFSRYYLQNAKLIFSNNNNNNNNSDQILTFGTGLELLSDAAKISINNVSFGDHVNVVTTTDHSIPNLRYNEDIYNLFSPEHLSYIQQLEAKYNRLPSYILSTSLVSGSTNTNEIAGSISSSTNAEIRLKGVLEVLVYLIYFVAPSYRLNVYSDVLFDIGSGNGHLLLLAYAGLGIENVMGIELVSTRAKQSIIDLCAIFNTLQFDCTYGYRNSNEYATADFSSYAGTCTRSKLACSKLSTFSDSIQSNINNNRSNSSQAVQNRRVDCSKVNYNNNVSRYNQDRNNNHNNNNYNNAHEDDNHNNHNGTDSNNSTQLLQLHRFNCPGTTKQNLLPPGLHIFDGDILSYVDNPKSEVYQRFHASSHLCLFDLMFSAASLQKLAGVLSNPAQGTTRWKVMVSMQSPFCWRYLGLNGWSTLGKMDRMVFKGGVQSATVYFYTLDNLGATETSTSKNACSLNLETTSKILPAAIIQRQLQLQPKQQQHDE